MGRETISSWESTNADQMRKESTELSSQMNMEKKNLSSISMLRWRVEWILGINKDYFAIRN